MAKALAKSIEIGNRSKINNPIYQLEWAVAIAASNKIIDRTPAFTAFIIFCGIFLVYAFFKGLKTINAKPPKKIK